MTTMTIERETLHKMIDELPQENLSHFIRLLQDDDEPLTDDEIAEIDAARAEVAAGEFVTWEELEKELAELP